MRILDRIRSVFRRKEVTLEDEAARREAQADREDMETLRTGARVGSENLTYRGKESRGR